MLEFLGGGGANLDDGDIKFEFDACEGMVRIDGDGLIINGDYGGRRACPVPSGPETACRV